jgi:hypothetical protein
MSRTSISRTESGRGQTGGRKPIAAILIGLFALVTAVCAIAGVWALAAPESPLTAVLPLSQPHAALAIKDLTPGARPVDLNAAERQTRWELALSPTTATAWLRLAYIDYWRHGRLTSAGLANLNRSYEIAPLGPDASAARMTLGFELWAQMTPDLRAQLLRELTAFRERDREAARAFAGRITNPNGRLVVGMAIAELDTKAQ